MDCSSEIERISIEETGKDKVNKKNIKEVLKDYDVNNTISIPEKYQFIDLLAKLVKIKNGNSAVCIYDGKLFIASDSLGYEEESITKNQYIDAYKKIITYFSKI